MQRNEVDVPSYRSDQRGRDTHAPIPIVVERASAGCLLAAAQARSTTLSGKPLQLLLLLLTRLADHTDKEIGQWDQRESG
jgi:hypothetical protein